MIFIINDKIVYNENKGEIMIADNEGSIIPLLKPTCRLLSILVRNNKVLISRERLLNEVWGDYGLKASNNNLNNYISMLRKAFASLGEDNIVITQPRLGFRFTALKIEPYKQNGEPLPAQKRKRQRRKWSLTWFKRAEKVAKTKAGLNIWSKIAMFATVSLLLLSALMLYQNMTENKLSLLGQYKHCRIYSVTGSSSLALIINMMRQSSYDCEKGGDVYYYSKVRDNETGPENSSKELLTYCPPDKSAACQNNYFYK